jgi:hypothetical protein
MAAEKPIQININPNLFALTNVNMGFGEEEFHFLLTSGHQGHQFLATPKHAKRILLLLQSQIEEYEKKHHVIEVSLPQTSKMDTKTQGIGF